MGPAAPGTADSGPIRITFQTTARATTALNAITETTGENRTDAINASLRVCATLLALTHPDGTLHVLAPDGTTHVVHLP